VETMASQVYITDYTTLPLYINQIVLYYKGHFIFWGMLKASEHFILLQDQFIKALG